MARATWAGAMGGLVNDIEAPALRASVRSWSVSTESGQTSDTATPVPRSSRASARANPRTPNFVAQYGASFGIGA